MAVDLTNTVFLIAAFVAALAMVQLVVAMMHDRAVTAAGPIEELAVYDARIEQKKTLLSDVEDELEKRREAIAHIADPPLNRALVDMAPRRDRRG